METIKRLPKRTNANSGKKAHNDNRYIKVGRVKRNSWINQALPAADILISEREVVHISSHREELAKLGIDSFTYIKMIIECCNEIRKDNRGGYLFIVKGERIDNCSTDQCAVIELKEKWIAGKRVYLIITARPMSWGRLKKIEFVCDNPRS